MRAQQDALRPAAGETCEEVPGVRADRDARAVLLDREAESAQLLAHAVRARPLSTGRTLDPAERRKGVVEPCPVSVARPPHSNPVTGLPCARP